MLNQSNRRKTTIAIIIDAEIIYLSFFLIWESNVHVNYNSFLFVLFLEFNEWNYLFCCASVWIFIFIIELTRNGMYTIIVIFRYVYDIIGI